MSDKTNGTAYIVMAEMDFDGGKPVFVFADESAAKEFAEACNEYRLEQPRSPDFGSSTDEEAFDEWDAAYREWDAKHPAGAGGWNCDRFKVYPIRMDYTIAKEPANA